MPLNTKFFTFITLFVGLSTSASAQVREIPELPVRTLTKPADIKESRLQDLLVFEDIIDINPSFTPTARIKAKEITNQIRSRASTITALEFLIELHRAYALNNNAHDEGRFALFVRGWGSLPFRGYWFDGQYRIIRVLPGREDLLGARVTHYGDMAIDEVNVKLKVLSSGTLDFFRSVVGDPLMTTPAVLHAMGIIPSADEVEIRFVLPNGSTKIEIIKPSDPGREQNPSTAAGRLLFPNFDNNGWTPLVPEAGIPLYLDGEDPLRGEPFIYAELGQHKIPYVQLRQNFSTEKQNLPDFIKDIEANWQGKQFPYIIIDLRLDQGGNTLLTQKFFLNLDQYLVPDGKIYVAIGHRTFSAGINGAALIKHGSNRQVIFIGENIGDRSQYWSETNRVSLPNNSDIKFTYSAALHDLENGCLRPECYWWYAENANPQVGEILPEVYVPFTFDNYSRGYDEILGKIGALENEDLIH